VDVSKWMRRKWKACMVVNPQERKNQQIAQRRSVAYVQLPGPGRESRRRWTAESERDSELTRTFPKSCRPYPFHNPSFEASRRGLNFRQLASFPKVAAGLSREYSFGAKLDGDQSAAIEQALTGAETSGFLGKRYVLRDPRGLTELRFGVCPGRHLADLPLCAEGSYRR